MTFLLLLPAILSFLVLAAHFLHAGDYPAMLISVLLPFVLLIRRRWVVYSVQVMLLLGAAAWLLTIIRLIGEYQEEGRPWLRMVIILGSVMTFTLASGMLFNIPRLRRRYGRTEQPSGFAPIMPKPPA